jgi:uncharacterized protein (UPF0332 family)
VKTHKELVSKFGLELVDEGVVETYYGRALRTAEEHMEEAVYCTLLELDRRLRSSGAYTSHKRVKIREG